MARRALAVFLGLVLATSVAAQLAPQKSSQSGVTVTVTPGELAGNVWSIKIVLDTHSQDLSDDLVKTVTLADGKGTEVKPLAWEGAAPGGHHREGVLKFEAIVPRPRSLEMRINRPGEAQPRIFRWEVP